MFIETSDGAIRFLRIENPKSVLVYTTGHSLYKSRYQHHWFPLDRIYNYSQVNLPPSEEVYF